MHPCPSHRTGTPQFYLAAVLDGLLQQILSGKLYLGVWGNSNFTETNQWIPVSNRGRQGRGGGREGPCVKPV